MWIIIKDEPTKRCFKCKSKKLKRTTVTAKAKDSGMYLYQECPADKCKKCGQYHVGGRAQIMEAALDQWLNEDHTGTVH